MAGPTRNRLAIHRRPHRAAALGLPPVRKRAGRNDRQFAGTPRAWRKDALRAWAGTRLGTTRVRGLASVRILHGPYNNAGRRRFASAPTCDRGGWTYTSGPFWDA